MAKANVDKNVQTGLSEHTPESESDYGENLWQSVSSAKKYGVRNITGITRLIKYRYSLISIKK